MSHDLFFFFNDTATTEIYTLSLHDALPIWPELRFSLFRRRQCPHHGVQGRSASAGPRRAAGRNGPARGRSRDRKSTRLNSSHANISYAVFCLKKKKK